MTHANFLTRVFSLVFSLHFFSTQAAESWVNRPTKPPTGVRHATFSSASINREIGFNVYLPPDYFTATNEKFPTVYYLHGFDGHESSYLGYAEILDRAIKNKSVPPMILVFANGGAQSYFCDAPDGGVMGETLVRELIAYVDKNWRTINSREGRSVHGFSMGGFGALKLAFKFPDIFGSVVAHGAVLPDASQLKQKQPKVFAKMFSNDLQRFEENDPFALAKKMAEQVRGRVAIRIDLGSKDELLPLNRKLDALLQELKIPHEYSEIPGVPHKKEPLYEKAALAGFQFSAQNFARKD